VLSFTNWPAAQAGPGVQMPGMGNESDRYMKPPIADRPNVLRSGQPTTERALLAVASLS